MTDIELMSYLLVFALSVIFSTFAVDRKSFTFSFLSMACWFTFATVHLYLAYASTLIVLAYLFMFLGLVFMVHGFARVFSSIAERKEEREWELA